MGHLLPFVPRGAWVVGGPHVGVVVEGLALANLHPVVVVGCLELQLELWDVSEVSFGYKKLV